VKLHFIFIKVNIPPDPASFTVGGQCEAIYSSDGKYYPCSIEKISDEGYTVKFKKYNNKETVSIYYMRESKKMDLGNKKKMFEDLEEFKQPDNLRYLPTDNEQ
jgi:survival-of-motor-neuron-related-splicing factor 30